MKILCKIYMTGLIAFCFINMLMVSGCMNKSDTVPIELILCGEQEVSIIQFDDNADPTFQKVWSWYAEDATGLPDSVPAW